MTGERMASSLARIRTAWARPDRASLPVRRSGPPGSCTPGGRGVLARADVAALVRRTVADAIEAGLIESGAVREADDVRALCTVLSAHESALEAADVSGVVGRALSRAARALEALTADPADTVRIGECPLERSDGAGPCGAAIRARADASVIVCPGCGHSASRERWRSILDAPGALVGTDELCSILLGIGVRLTPSGIRVRVHRGRLSRAESADARGRALYDPERVMREILTAGA